MSISSFYQRALRLLRVRGKSAGLEITDTALRIAWQSSGGLWQTAAVRLPPGIVQEGRVVDAAQFRGALQSLRAEMGSFAKGDTPIHTVVTVGSVPVYTQVFNLPVLERERLEEAAALNLAMFSPMEAGKAYSGWQTVGTDEKSMRLDILSAFIDRAIVDSFIGAMKEEQFIVGVVEPKVLSLARLVRARAAGFDPAAPSLFIVQGETGLQLLILKNGALYFQHFVSWAEIQAGNREITWDVFSQAFAEHLRKVLNFHVSHVRGTLSEVFLVASDLKDGILQILTGQFNLNARELQLTFDAAFDPDWFAAIGAGIRGLVPLADDKELSLLGITARGEFVRQQTLRFLSFWRVALPVWLAALLLFAFGVNVLVGRSRADAEREAQAISASEQGMEIQTLAADARAFNAALAALERAAGGAKKIPILEKVQAQFDAYGVTFTRFSLGGGGGVSVEGRIPSEEKLLELAAAIRASDEFADLGMPLQEIVADENGVSFSMTFSIISPKTP